MKYNTTQIIFISNLKFRWLIMEKHDEINLDDNSSKISTNVVIATWEIGKYSDQVKETKFPVSSHIHSSFSPFSSPCGAIINPYLT